MKSDRKMSSEITNDSESTTTYKNEGKNEWSEKKKSKDWKSKGNKYKEIKTIKLK